MTGVLAAVVFGVTMAGLVSGATPVFSLPPTEVTVEITETLPAGQVVYTVMSSDPDGHAMTLSIVKQMPASPAFTLETTGAGVAELRSPGGLNATVTNSFDFIFLSYDGTFGAISKTLTVTITEVNEKPDVWPPAASGRYGSGRSGYGFRLTAKKLIYMAVLFATVQFLSVAP